jgi:hypothetical protein
VGRLECPVALRVPLGIVYERLPAEDHGQAKEPRNRSMFFLKVTLTYAGNDIRFVCKLRAESMEVIAVHIFALKVVESGLHELALFSRSFIRDALWASPQGFVF